MFAPPRNFNTLERGLVSWYPWTSLPALSGKDKTPIIWLTGIRTALQKLTALACTESSDGNTDDDDDADDDDDDSCDSRGNWNEQLQQSLYFAEIQLMRNNSSLKQTRYI